MKSAIKQSLEQILVKSFTDFALDEGHDSDQIRSYVEGVINEFSRYLRAYNEFKED